MPSGPPLGLRPEFVVRRPNDSRPLSTSPEPRRRLREGPSPRGRTKGKELVLHLAARPLAIALAVILSMVVSAGGTQAATPRSADPSLMVLTPVAMGVGPSIARSPVSDRRGEQTREQPLLPLNNGNGHGKPGGGGGGGGTIDGALQTTVSTDPLGTVVGQSVDGV